MISVKLKSMAFQDFSPSIVSLLIRYLAVFIVMKSGEMTTVAKISVLWNIM